MKLSDLKPGDKLKADSGFSCIEPNAICIVQEIDGRLFVKCTSGHHFLDGQTEPMDDPHGEMVGFTYA